MRNNTKLYSLLTIAGTAPFVAGMICLLIGVSSLPVLGPVGPLMSAYGLAIVAFMSGSHWGLYKRIDQKNMPNYFLTSNFITLAAVFGFVLLTGAAYFILLTVLFMLLLWFEKDFHRIGVIGLHYLKIRVQATIVVAISLMTSYVVSS